MAFNIQVDYRNPTITSNGLVYQELQGDPLSLKPAWVLNAGFQGGNGSARVKLVDKNDAVFLQLIGNSNFYSNLQINASNENKVVSVKKPNGAEVKIDSDLFNGGKISYEVSGQTRGGFFRVTARPVGSNTDYFGVLSGQGTATIEFDLLVS